MSIFVSQRLETVRRGESAVAATVVKLASNADTVELPNMAAASNCVVQLRRPGDPTVAVSQTDVNTVSLSGSTGDEVLLISLHDDPTPELR